MTTFRNVDHKNLNVVKKKNFPPGLRKKVIVDFHAEILSVLSQSPKIPYRKIPYRKKKPSLCRNVTAHFQFSYRNFFFRARRTKKKVFPTFKFLLCTFLNVVENFENGPKKKYTQILKISVWILLF